MDVTKTTDGTRIPRIIHQIWYQGWSELPKKYHTFYNSWDKNHPEWEHWFWDADRMRALIKEHYPEYMDLYDRYTLDIQRIDAIRYFILDKYGGFYFDMDMESVKSIDELLGDHTLILSKTIGYNNACVGSIPGHPLWRHVHENLPIKLKAVQDRSDFYKKYNTIYVTETTGPRFFYECVKEGQFDQLNKTKIYPGHYFEPGSPVMIDGKLTRSSESGSAFVRHYGDGKWNHPVTRALSVISKRIFGWLWALKGGK